MLQRAVLSHQGQTIRIQDNGNAWSSVIPMNAGIKSFGFNIFLHVELQRCKSANCR